MAEDDEDLKERKKIELAEDVFYLMRHRETLCGVAGLALGASVGGTVSMVSKDPKNFITFKRSVYFYDMVACSLILLLELYSLSYYHPNCLFCFSKKHCPKCSISDWVKLVLYLILAAPNYIWCRESSYGLAIMGEIAGIGVVYFIHIMIENFYINPMIQKHMESNDAVGLAVGEGALWSGAAAVDAAKAAEAAAAEEEEADGDE